MSITDPHAIVKGFYWVRPLHRDPFPFDPELGDRPLTIAQVSGRTAGNYQVTILHQPRSLTVAEALRQVEFIELIERPAAFAIAA